MSNDKFTGVPAKGLILNLLTGGRLASWLLHLGTASPDTILVYALDLATIAAQLDGPRSEISRSRDRLAGSRQAVSGEMTREDLTRVEECAGDVKTALVAFSGQVRHAAEEIRAARDKLDRIITSADRTAGIQLKIPFIGWSLATVTAVGAVGATAAVLVALHGTLSDIADQMLVEGAERTAVVTDRAGRIVAEPGTARLRTARISAHHNSFPSNGQSLTVSDRP